MLHDDINNFSIKKDVAHAEFNYEHRDLQRYDGIPKNIVPNDKCKYGRDGLCPCYPLDDDFYCDGVHAWNLEFGLSEREIARRDQAYGECKYNRFPTCEKGKTKLCPMRKPRLDKFFDNNPDDMEYYIDYDCVKCVPEDENCSKCSPGIWCPWLERCVGPDAKNVCWEAYAMMAVPSIQPSLQPSSLPSSFPSNWQSNEPTIKLMEITSATPPADTQISPSVSQDFVGSPKFIVGSIVLILAGIVGIYGCYDILSRRRRRTKKITRQTSDELIVEEMSSKSSTSTDINSLTNDRNDIDTPIPIDNGFIHPTWHQIEIVRSRTKEITHETSDEFSVEDLSPNCSTDISKKSLGRDQENVDTDIITEENNFIYHTIR